MVSEKIRMVLDRLGNSANNVCVHHRAGDDWTKHCDKWGSIRDGVWRKNCMSEPGQTLSMDLNKRWASASREAKS